ncbi:hypothetical protein BJ165DRAFT_1353589, partial [Panaeolus papilionaceus]
VVVAALFQGMLMIQAYNYFENFPNDRLRNKLIVSSVMVCALNPSHKPFSSLTSCSSHSILDTGHLILISMATYSNLVTNWGYIPSLGFAPLELNLHLVFTALSCLVAQLFFLERIWRFSRKNIWITGTLLLFALAPAVLEVHITTLIVQNTSVAEYAKNKDETMALFVSTAVADICLAVVTCYYLQKEKSAFATTQSVVSKALQIVVGSGMATSMIAIGGLILALHFQLGRTYTNALLLTYVAPSDFGFLPYNDTKRIRSLNARRQMRHMLSEPFRPNHLDSNHLELGLACQTHDVESIICIVQKQIETDSMSGTTLFLDSIKSEEPFESDVKKKDSIVYA